MNEYVLFVSESNGEVVILPVLRYHLRKFSIKFIIRNILLWQKNQNAFFSALKLYNLSLDSPIGLLEKNVLRKKVNIMNLFPILLRLSI